MPWPWPGAVLWGPEASPAPGCAAMLGCFFHVFLRDQWWSWISLLQIFRLKFRLTLNNHSNSTELISSKKQKQRILALAQVHESHRCPGRNLAMRWRIRRISYDLSFIPTEKCHTSNPTEDKSVIVIIHFDPGDFPIAGYFSPGGKAMPAAFVALTDLP